MEVHVVVEGAVALFFEMAMSCTRNSINQFFFLFKKKFFFFPLFPSFSLLFFFFFFPLLFFLPCLVSFLSLLSGVHRWFSLEGQRTSAFRHWARPAYTLVI